MRVVSATVLILKHKIRLAFAYSDLKSCLERGRQSPKNVFKGLKLDLCQAALMSKPSLSLKTQADKSLIGFSSVTSKEEFQN